MYSQHKQQRSSMPSKEDVLLEMIKLYHDVTNKRDKKRAAKLLIKAEVKLKEYGYWDFLNEEELRAL